MRYLYCFFLSCSASILYLLDRTKCCKTETKEIENGKITKQYIQDDKLNSFTVDIAAVNYGNTLFFTKKIIFNYKRRQKS